ncbi:MAG: HEAT repeat domain-containing protein [Proteobacteria bacterium]|nr:HEAT repeat domain-containing protein [Pseudomonadota bacterium]
MSTTEKLLGVIKNGDARDQVEAVFELAKEGDYQYIDLLVQALEDEDWEVRRDAAYYLGRIGWRSAVEKLGELIANDPMDDNKNVAIYAAQSTGFPSAAPLIIKGLEDENPEIRIDCRTALYRLFGDSIVLLLDPEEEELMEDSEDRRRAYLNNAEEIRAWWQATKDAYDHDKTYFMGQEATPALIFEEFKKAPNTNDAYLELLEDWTGQEVGEYSRKMLKLWDSWLSRHGSKFQKGKKYFYGKELPLE